ncbi:hypothetical protein CA834_08400 [Winogradskyella aurantia]|uniref:Uncharacterized protein n=2 Tax=Winogradskyella aurantia TaxID=1915063 RepID=A0A265UTS7_9FLAO|nr:hypothetical protein CA834_08400 [Winogradskyella aurantia]
MIEGKRLKNYLIYGLGEIVLVVIGIMLALAMNNWKEEQSDQKELDRIITVIAKDLEGDLSETKEVISGSKLDQELTVKMLYNPKFKDSIRGCEDCRYILARVAIPNYNSNGYNLLSNFNKDVKTNSKKVDSIVKFYSAYKREAFEVRHNIILEEIVDNMKYLRDNFDWFSEWFISGKCNDGCLDYFTGQDYMNRLTYYEAIYFDDYLYGVEQYQKDLKAMLRYLKS